MNSRSCRLSMTALVVTIAAHGAPASASAAGGCEHADARPGEVSYAALGRATLCLVNRERRGRGIPALRPERRLARAATRHARDMVRHSYFTHASRSGAPFTARVRRAGYTRGAGRWWAGENMAWGSDERSTPRRIVRAWMRSPGHRVNVLDRSFRDLGVGVAAGAPVEARHRAAATYVHDFGVRRQ